MECQLIFDCIPILELFNRLTIKEIVKFCLINRKYGSVLSDHKFWEYILDRTFHVSNPKELYLSKLEDKGSYPLWFYNLENGYTYISALRGEVSDSSPDAFWEVCDLVNSMCDEDNVSVTSILHYLKWVKRLLKETNGSINCCDLDDKIILIKNDIIAYEILVRVEEKR